MPNWCENYITFMSNGTPEGDLALQDLYNKIVNTPKYNGLIWESNIEACCFDQCNSLFEYQNKIPTHKRGYVANISDINFGTFHVVTYDAWCANNAFWYYLIKRLYGNNNLITFTFMATEPNMGLYYTNDPGLLPRYNLDVSVENGMEDLMKIPAAWDYSNSKNNLFMFLNNQNPFVSINLYNMNKYSFGFYLTSEGDEDDIISDCEEYIFGKDMPDITNIEQLTNKIKDMGLEVFMKEFEYVDLGDEIRNEIIRSSVVVKATTESEKDNDTFIKETNDKLKEVSDELGIYIEPLKMDNCQKM